MKRNVLYLMILIMLSGCSANWHLTTAMKKDPDIIKSEKTIEWIKSKIGIDTTLRVPIKDILTLDTVPVIRYEKEYINEKEYIYPSFDTIVDRSNGLTAKIWMFKGKLGYEFEIDSTATVQLKDSIEALNKVITDKTVVKIKEKGVFRQYFIYVIIILVIILLIKIVPFRRRN